MSDKNNAISLLIPIRNGLKYLPKFKEMIEGNSDLNDEVVIIDDGSNDGTSEWLKTWSKTKNNFKLINTVGVGIVESLNLGLKEASNRWVARFDVDDEYELTRLTKQKKYIKDGAVAIFSDYDFIDELGNKYGILSSPILPSATAISLVNSSRTAHPSVMFDREAVLESGGYLQEDFPAEDLGLWLRLIKLGDIISIPERLLHYRIRKGSVTNENRVRSIAKKQDLISKSSHLNQHFEYCINNFERILQSYEKEDYADQRKILFVRDLLASRKSLPIKIKKKYSILNKSKKMFLNPGAVSTLMSLGFDQYRRKKLRNGLNQ